MKKLITFIVGCLCFMFIDNVYAYVVLDTNYGVNTIHPTNRVLSMDGSDWGTSGVTYSKTDPWIYSASQFWYVGGVSGNHITVSADYYVGIKNEMYSDSSTQIYISSLQNTLTAANLRCGIGDSYQSGYKSNYAPVVTDFSATFIQNVEHYSGSQTLFNIKFTYNQDIPQTTQSNTNMSCWFVRSPSNGLFTQVISGLSPLYTHYYYYDFSLRYAVSSDPASALLTDITNQNDTIISQNQTQINQNDTIISQNNQTNQKLDGINSSITSTESPDLGSLSDTAGWLPAGPVDSILNLPLTMLNNLSTSIGSTCQPISITLPFVNTNMELPCLNSLYAKIDGLSVWMNSIGIIAAGFILYTYLLNLYKFVDDTLTMRENSWNDVNQWGGI